MLTVVLTADSDAELNDVCSFIKIDTSQTEKAESEYSSEKATEEVVVEKVKTQEVSEFLANPYSYCMPAARKLLEVDFADNYSDTYIFTLGLFKGKSNSQIDSFLGKPLEDGTKETEGKFGIRAVFGFNIDVEVYADYHIFTDSFYDIELRSNFTLELDLAAIENVNVGLGVIYIPLISSLAHLTVEPKFNIWGFGGLKLKREFSNSLTIDSTKGINGNPEYYQLDDNLQLEAYEANQIFYGCSNLKRVNFADSAVNIAKGMFNSCEDLEYVRLSPNTKTEVLY